jgi:aminomethyltransferase
VLAALAAAQVGHDVVVTNLGYKNAYLSIQGPRSLRALLSALTDADLSTAALPYYSFTMANVADVPNTLLSRTGYSGELGYEIFYPVEYAEHVGDRVFAAGAELGVCACGLGRAAHTSPRKEIRAVRARRQRHDHAARSGPGLDRQVRQAAIFGQEALSKQREAGAARRLVLIEFPTLDFVPSVGASIRVEGRDVGKVTSADRGYAVGKALALGFVASAHARQGQEVTVSAPEGNRPGASI